MEAYKQKLIEDVLKISDEHLIDVILNHSRIMYFKKNEMIRREQDPIYEVYICVEGIYKHIVYDEDGKKILKCMNLSPDSSGIILNADFKINEQSCFAGECVAATDCVIVAIPLTVVQNEYNNNEALRQVVAQIYQESISYYCRMCTYQQLKGIKRYKALVEYAAGRWDLLSDYDKALNMNMDYAYWMRFKKNNKVELKRKRRDENDFSH